MLSESQKDPVPEASLDRAHICSMELKRALEDTGLQSQFIFLTGHSGCQVVLAKDDRERQFVLKFPTNTSSQQEVLDNIRGYKEMAKEGVSEMVPNHTIGTLDDKIYLVMEYLGKDFATSTEDMPHPEELYSTLCDRMLPIYAGTRKMDGRSNIFLERMLERIRENFFQYIIPAEMASASAAHALVKIRIEELKTDYSTFGVFDFTPEDIFLTQTGVMYPDPKHEVRGNPIVDLACFSGVSRDALKLPGSVQGYDCIEQCASDAVANILHLTETQARRIFLLGRALQCSFSSRFRIEKEPELASVYADQSLKYLQTI